MRARTARRALGVVFILTFVILLVLAGVLVSQGFLGAGVGEQVRRSIRAEEAAMLAESFADEALVRIALDANGGPDGTARTETFRRFRDPRAARPPDLGFDVPVPELPAAGRLLAAHPLHRSPPPAVSARVRFQRYFYSDGVAEHDERFGTLEVAATVSYPRDRGTAQRRLTKWVEFKVVKPGPPAPFDRTPLFIHDPEAFVNAHARLPGSGRDSANDVMSDAATVLRDLPGEVAERLRRVDQHLADIRRALATGGIPSSIRRRLRDLEDHLQQVRAALVEASGAVRQALEDNRVHVTNALSRLLLRPDEPRLFGWPFVMYFWNWTRSQPRFELDRINLPALTRSFVPVKIRADREHTRARAAWQQLETSVEQQLRAGQVPSVDLATPGRALASAMLGRARAQAEVLRAYREFQASHVEWAGEDRVRVFERCLALLAEDVWANGLTAGGALRAGKAQILLDAGAPPAAAASPDALARRLHEVLDRYGPPFSGIIHVQNAGGPALVLDSTREATARWGRFSGRLVLAVSGDCTLRDVVRADPARDMLTVVCYGTLTIGGRVESSLVPWRSLHRLPPAGGQTTRIVGNLILTDRAFRDPDVPPEKVLERIVLERDDRIPSWDDRAGNKPEHSSVLFGPVPVYVASPRQVTP
jgi:hypothetical protein